MGILPAGDRSLRFGEQILCQVNRIFKYKDIKTEVHGAICTSGSIGFAMGAADGGSRPEVGAPFLARSADAGVSGNTTRRRDAARGGEGRRVVCELTERDTRRRVRRKAAARARLDRPPAIRRGQQPRGSGAEPPPLRALLRIIAPNSTGEPMRTSRWRGALGALTLLIW